MLWVDKCREWANSDVTEAIRKIILDNIKELSLNIVYEEDTRRIIIMQGLQRAYYDMLDIINNWKDIEEPKKSEKGEH